MDFGAIPPEIHSARMHTGPGSGPMLAAASAWNQLATNLRSTEASYRSEIFRLADESWLGPASKSMESAAAPYMAWMGATAAQCEHMSSQAMAAVSAYEAAFAMTVPPPLIAANRTRLATLVATNILGQNTPAIAVAETHYGEMWAQNAAAMYGYAAHSAAASTLNPFGPPPLTTSPAGHASQTAAVAHATATAAGSHIQTLSHLTSTVPALLNQLASPASASGLSGTLTGTGTSTALSAGSATSSLSSAHSSLANAASGLGGIAGLLGGSGGTSQPPSTEGLTLVAAGLGLTMEGAGLSIEAFGALGEVGVAEEEVGVAEEEVAEIGVEEGQGIAAGTEPLGGLGALAAPAGLGEAAAINTASVPQTWFHNAAPAGAIIPAGASASVGQAVSVGTLSVPQVWADAAAPIQATNAAETAAPPTPGFNNAPPVWTGGPSTPKFPLGSMIPRAANSTIDRIGWRPTMVPRSPIVG